MQTCATCSTDYAEGLEQCPHCQSPDVVAPTLRIPTVQVACVTPGCGARGKTARVRLQVVAYGFVVLPTFLCSACGGTAQVERIWPKEGTMPKITNAGGPSNAAADPVTADAAGGGDPEPVATPEPDTRADGVRGVLNVSRAAEPTPAEIRAWAADNHIDVAPSGTIPRTVRKAYDDAHTG